MKFLIALPQTHLTHFRDLPLCLKLCASPRNPMGTMGRVRWPNDDVSIRNNLYEPERHTSFASFSASSNQPLAMYALLRLMKRSCRGGLSRESAAEYMEMASSCCSSVIAVSPRPSSFSEQRRLKSYTRNSHINDDFDASGRSLTENPFTLPIMHVCLVR